MESHLLKATTYDGSAFIIRFDPLGKESGILYGRTHLIGYARSIDKAVEFKGIGCLPEEGGRIVVSPDPVETVEMEGVVFPIFPSETIQSVVEIELPDSILQKLPP